MVSIIEYVEGVDLHKYSSTSEWENDYQLLWKAVQLGVEMGERVKLE